MAQTNRIRGRMQAREAEAWSLEEALIWTSKWRTRRCIFETNVKSVVDAIHEGGGIQIFTLLLRSAERFLNTLRRC